MYNNIGKKAFVSAITGAVLMVLVIGVAAIVITSNSDKLDFFNNKVNETINYTLSSKLNVSQFDLEERKDALKIFIATEFLSNPTSEYMKSFEKYKIDCNDNEYTNCYNIDETIIYCKEKKCLIDQFNLEDNLDEFREENLITSGTIEKENCENLYNWEKQACEINNAYIEQYSLDGKIINSNNDEIEELYRNTYALPTRYIAYGTLPENEIDNLQTAFNEKVTTWKTISTYGFVALTALDFIDLGGNVAKFVSKNYNPKLIAKIGEKFSSFAFIDMKNAGKAKTILTGFIPDLFKYDSAITGTGKKISTIFLDDNVVDLYKNAKNIAEKVDNFDNFALEFKKMSNIDIDTLENGKLNKYYNELISNKKASISSLEYQLSFELTQNQPKISIAKTLVSTALYDLYRKSDSDKTISLLSSFAEPLNKFKKYSGLRNTISDNIDTADNIIKKITNTGSDAINKIEFSKSELDFIEEISEELGGQIAEESVETSVQVLKSSAFLDNYNVLKGKKKLIDTEMFQFNNKQYEEIFANSAEYLTRYLTHEVVDEDIMQLLIENSFIKLSKEAMQNSNIKKVVKNAINNINLEDFTQGKAIKIISGDSAVKIGLDEDIILELGNEAKYKLSGDQLNQLTKKKSSKDIINELLANTHGSPIDPTETSNLKSISFNIKSNIDLTNNINPDKKMDLIKQLNKDFPLVNSENIDEIYDEIYDIQNGKKTLDNILEIDQLNIIQNEKIFNDIMNDIEFNPKLVKYIEIEEQFNSQYERIFNIINNKPDNELLLGLEKSSKVINTNSNFDLYEDAMQNSESFNNNFFSKYNSNTYTMFQSKNMKSSIIRKVAQSTKETVAMASCYSLFVNVFEKGIFNYDEKDLLEEFNDKNKNNKNDYITELKENYNEFSTDEKNAFNNYFNINNENQISNIIGLQFASYCLNEASFAVKKGLFRTLINYLQLENSYYLPNEISSIDTISLYNGDNYYSFDQLEYFSPLQLSNFEDYILRLKKRDNWYEPFYLISPCNATLTFEESETTCTYGIYDYVYNGYTLNGNTANLNCNKVKLLDETSEILDNNFFKEDENIDIINNYNLMYSYLLQSNDLDSEIIKDFLYILLDRNLKYSSYHFIEKSIEFDEEINEYETYLKIVNSFSNIILPPIQTINNFVEFNQIGDNFNLEINDILINKNAFTTRISNEKNFLPFLKNYNEYHIPSFSFNNSNIVKLSNIRKYNNINEFTKINNNFIPIIVKIDDEKFKDDIAEINLQFPQNFILNNTEFDLFLNNYKNDNNMNNNYYIFDIIYDENQNFNYTEYKDYFNLFVVNTQLSASNRVIDIDYTLNFGKYSTTTTHSYLQEYFTPYPYPTLFETGLYLDGFDNSFINYIYNLEDNKFNKNDLQEILKIIYDNNLYNLISDYINTNQPYYYDCTNTEDITYQNLYENKITKECKKDGLKELPKTKTIDVSLTNINEESYCYYYPTTGQQFYEENNVKMSMIMTIPGVVGGILGPSPVGIALQIIDVGYSLYDLKMTQDIKKNNKWPNSGLTK